jgi:hypothetical protein
MRQLLDHLASAPTAASLEELQQIERYFPLDSDLHEQIGIRELIVASRPDEAWREFRIVDRLSPASWTLPSMQAWLARDVSPGMSFHFWSLAIERSGRRAPDIFTAAYNNSIDLKGGAEFWQSYVEGHPEFLLCYAQAVSSDEKGKAAFDEWWKQRGASGASLEDWELTGFYYTIRKWGDRTELGTWMKLRGDREAADYKTWAAILHDWQMDADAWAILSRRIKEPDFPASSDGETIEALEANWRANPGDPVSAQAYARQCSLNGDSAKSDQVILSVASGKNPPPWFIEKAAFLYAAKKDYSTAVTSLLRLDGGDS